MEVMAIEGKVVQKKEEKVNEKQKGQGLSLHVTTTCYP